MINNRSTLIKGMLDGAVRGVIVYCLVEFLSSKYVSIPYSSAFIALLTCIIVSVIAFFLFAQSVPVKLFAFYGFGHCFFMLFVILILINYMTINVHIFPLRELNNGDGLLLILILGIYLLVSEVMRLLVLIAMIVTKKNIHIS